MHGAGDELLAGAALTINQHGAGGGSYGADSGFQFFNDRAAANKVIERVAAGGIALEGEIFPLKHKRLQGRVPQRALALPAGRGLYGCSQTHHL